MQLFRYWFQTRLLSFLPHAIPKFIALDSLFFLKGEARSL
jgi:hypothetical protein